MGYERCKICKEWHFTNIGCLPVFFVYHEEYGGDDPIEVRAGNHEDAALKHAERYNSSHEYSMLDDDDGIKIEVSDGKGPKLKYIISAERTIDYKAELQE